MHEPPFLVEPFSPPLGDARCITVANSEIRVRCGQSQSTPDVMIDATHSLIWFEPRRAAPTKVKHPRRMKLQQVELLCCATASAWFYGGSASTRLRGALLSSVEPKAIRGCRSARASSQPPRGMAERSCSGSR